MSNWNISSNTGVGPDNSGINNDIGTVKAAGNVSSDIFDGDPVSFGSPKIVTVSSGINNIGPSSSKQFNKQNSMIRRVNDEIKSGASNSSNRKSINYNTGSSSYYYKRMVRNNILGSANISARSGIWSIRCSSDETSNAAFVDNGYNLQRRIIYALGSRQSIKPRLNLLNVPPGQDLHIYVARAIRDRYDGVQLQDGLYELFRVPALNPKENCRFVMQGSGNSVIKLANDLNISDQSWTNPMIMLGRGDLTIRNCTFDLARRKWVSFRKIISANWLDWMDKFFADYADDIVASRQGRISRFVFENNTIIDSFNGRKSGTVEPTDDDEPLRDNWVFTLKTDTRFEEDGVSLLKHGEFIARNNFLNAWDAELTGGAIYFDNIDMSNNVVLGGNHTGAFFSNFDKRTPADPLFTVSTLRMANNTVLNEEARNSFGIGYDSDDVSPFNFLNVQVFGNWIKWAKSEPDEFITPLLLKLYRNTGEFYFFNNTIDASAVDPSLTGDDFNPRYITHFNDGWDAEPSQGKLFWEPPSIIFPEGNVQWNPTFPEGSIPDWESVVRLDQ